MTPLQRERELADIEAVRQRAVDGRGGVVVVEGPAGIGKSAVLDEARRQAASQMKLLGARGGPLEREFGFGVVRQLLEVVAHRREVPEAARAALADPTVDAGAGEGSFAVLHALFWVVLDLSAEEPLLLSVDDLQWSDRPSLRFLAYLARRVEELPVMLLATVRTGEPDVDEDLLGAVRQSPAVVITPGPLGHDAVATLIGERLGETPEREFVAACHTATGGNPLLVKELLAGLEFDQVRPRAGNAEVVRRVGPRAVSRTVGARLARLDADALATAQAVAVLGDGVPVAAAAQLTGLDEARVAAATGPLAGADILRPDPPLAFVHPLVADAVLGSLPPGERELQHARAAQLLRGAGAPAEQVAGHLLRTPPGDQPWAVPVLRDAAGVAMRRGAPDSAAAFLRRALDESVTGPDRPQLLLGLGLAEALSSGPQAVEHLRSALAALVEPEQRALAASVLGRILMFTGRAADGAAVAEEVAAEMDEAHADLRDQLVGFALMTSWFDHRAPHGAQASAAYRQLLPDPQAGPGPRMIASTTSFGWATEAGPRDACVELAGAALAHGHLLRADPGFLFIPPVGVLWYAERPEAVVHLEQGLAEAHRSGSLMAAAGLRMWLGAARMDRSELQDAEAHVRQAEEELTLWGFDVGGMVNGFLVSILVRRGKLTEARAALERADPASPPAEAARHYLNAQLELLVAERRDEDALATAAVLETEFGHVRNPAMAHWRSLRAGPRHRSGDAAGAREDLDAELALATAWGAPGPIGRVLRVRGELFDAEEDLRDAVSVLSASLMRLEHARALLALGRRLRLDRSPTEARDPLREALDIAAACSADGLVEEARAELAAAGVRPRTDALAGPAALTPSERRVADLAAAGRTNRDIAQELFVTPKTVEVHLSAVYRKLGIDSRRQLTTALA